MAQAFKISDFLTQRQFYRLGLYNEFFRRIGLEHEMVTLLPSSSPLLLVIALDRSVRDFSERDRLLLNLLHPHLVQAYHNAKSVTHLQQDSAYIREAVEELDRGVIALTRKNRVQWCTKRARVWMSEYFEPSRRAECLPESLQRWVERQRLLLSKVGDVPPPIHR